MASPKLEDLSVVPMGDEPDGDEGADAPPGDDSDGLRESFDELADDLGIPEENRDGAFEKLKGFVEQCCAQMDYGK